MFEGLIAFFQILPKLFTVMSQLGHWIKQKQVQSWLDNLEKSFEQVENAKTPEEKQNAAQALVRAIRNSK